MNSKRVRSRLVAMGDRGAAIRMTHFGVNVDSALGVSMPKLRALAKDIGHNHALALDLWASGVHEARILAALIDEPDRVTAAQMERWVKRFDSWDVCDCCCGSLFDRTPFAYRKAIEWSRREEEYVKRAGFVLMASLAVHDKTAPDSKFTRFLPQIKRQSRDGRNFVRKAVNWALRQIGKRNRALNLLAIETASEIRQMNSGTAKWIASDALRELTGKTVQKRFVRQRKRPKK